MRNLNQIKATPKSGEEKLSNNGINIQYSLLDFWQWSSSDILSNTIRGRFAEFIVGTAIGLNPKDIRTEWDAYDLTAVDGIKIEVKSAAYIQSWKQKRFSAISFSIKPTRHWDAETIVQGDEAKRHADIYVFCHLKHKDQDTIDPFKMEQWDFYVLPTYRLDDFNKNQSSISLKSVKELTQRIEYADLPTEIKRASKAQKDWSVDK